MAGEIFVRQSISEITPYAEKITSPRRLSPLKYGRSNRCGLLPYKIFAMNFATEPPHVRICGSTQAGRRSGQSRNMTNDSERPGANFAGRNSRIVTASAWTLLGINFYRAAETWLTQPSSKQRKRITTKMLFLRNKKITAGAPRLSWRALALAYVLAAAPSAFLRSTAWF